MNTLLIHLNSPTKPLNLLPPDFEYVFALAITTPWSLISHLWGKQLLLPPAFIEELKHAGRL